MRTSIAAAAGHTYSCTAVAAVAVSPTDLMRRLLLVVHTSSTDFMRRLLFRRGSSSRGVQYPTNQPTNTHIQLERVVEAAGTHPARAQRGPTSPPGGEVDALAERGHHTLYSSLISKYQTLFPKTSGFLRNRKIRASNMAASFTHRTHKETH